MRMLLALLALSQGLAAAESAGRPPAVVEAPASQGSLPGAEEHFQAARRAYLAGDRSGALRSLNEVLKTEPYHTGAATLFQTIRDEERKLRQVRLAPLPGPPAAQPKPVAEAAEAQAGRVQRLWGAVQSLESRLNRKLERGEQRLDAGLTRLDEGLGEQRKAQAELRGRQDDLSRSQERLLYSFGLGGVVLAILLILVLLAVLKLGRDLDALRWRDRDAGHGPRR